MGSEMCIRDRYIMVYCDSALLQLGPIYVYGDVYIYGDIYIYGDLKFVKSTPMEILKNKNL